MSSNGYQHMVIDYYVERMRGLRARRTGELRGISTPEAARAYQAKVRERVEAAFGPWPERVPADVRTGETIRMDGFRIEKLSFATRRNFRATAALYVPDGLAAPAPAVLAACGHAEAGKSCDVYQEFCQRLAGNGFVVLHVDPIQQGERGQYAGVPIGGGHPMPGLCGLHNTMGKQMELIGEYFGAWRVWDGRCALDVLLARPEVDARHVGVTGNSGGGTLSEWLWACDDRLAMAAPSCHVSSWLNHLENELPADAEQYPPGLIGAGLEMIDLMIMRAPKPAILLGQKYDFFERRGLAEAFSELREFYRILGAEDRTELFIGPEGHGYSVHNQEAMVDFFCRQCGRAPRRVECRPLPGKRLDVLPEGDVVKAGSDPVFKLIQRRESVLAAARPRLTREGLARKLTELLALPERRGVPHYRIPRCLVLPGAGGEESPWARYAVETEEPGIRAILLKNTPDGRCHTLDVERELTLYIPDVSSEEDITRNLQTRRAVAEAKAFYAVDPRGMGESRQEEQHGSSFLADYGADYMMHGYALMFGESYLGRRVFDVLRVVDLLRSQGAESIRLCGRGQGSILAAFAAVLDPRIGSVELLDWPMSYREWIDEPFDRWPAASHLKGALKHFDLPDVVRVLGSRARVLSTWNALRR